MADSHDNLEMIRKAVKFFNEKQVSAVLYAGDLVSPINVKGFTELEAPLHLVFGNNEGDRITIKEWFVK
ncbi:MAG: phosphodiesterase, MJ0936 family, partial [Methanohalophilus sp. T328-1]